MITSIILCAGESQRFGSPKALVKLHRKTALEMIQESLLHSLVDEIIVVLGAYAPLLKPLILNHSKIRFVYNKDYKMGQTSSVQVALKTVAFATQGFFLWPVDYPLICQQTVNQLIYAFQKERSASIVIPTFQKRKGHPPLFPQAVFADILRLSHTTGVNQIFKKYSNNLTLVDVADAGVITTFNSPREWEGIKRNWDNVLFEDNGRR